MMRVRNSILGLAAFLALVAVAPAMAQFPILNEFQISHTGVDDHEFVEIYGAPNTDYSDWTIIEIEGEPSATGTIDNSAFTAGTTDANGLWVTPFQNNRWENGSLTLMLVRNFAPSEGTSDDIDTDDDGVIDTTFWDAIADSVGVNTGDSGDFTYGEVELVVSFDGAPFAPGGASRIPNGTDTNSISDWKRNDFDNAGIPGFAGTLDTGAGEVLNTPGAPNMVPEPATLALMLLGAVALRRTRQR